MSKHIFTNKDNILHYNDKPLLLVYEPTQRYIRVVSVNSKMVHHKLNYTEHTLKKKEYYTTELDKPNNKIPEEEVKKAIDKFNKNTPL